MKMGSPGLINVVGTLFGTLIIALSAYYAYTIQSKKDEEDNVKLVTANNELKDQNKALSTTIDKLLAQNTNLVILTNDLKQKSGELTDQLVVYVDQITQYASKQQEDANKQQEYADRIIKLQDDLKVKADELKKNSNELYILQKEQNNYLTGGNSQCYVYLHSPSDHDIKVRLVHRGKYPLSALRIQIVRSSDLIKEANGDPTRLKHLGKENNHTIVFPIGPLPATSETFEIGSISYDPNIDDNYSIKFIAQNGVWKQNYSTEKNGFKPSNLMRWDGSPMPDPYK